MRKPENVRTSRTVKAALLSGLVLLALSLCLILPLFIRGTETIVAKTRYTSICTHCGVQTAADFYYLFDSEIAQSHQLLPISRKTLFRAQNAEHCSHDYVPVGKILFHIARDGSIIRTVRGKPSGDTEFEKAEIKETFLALASQNPEAASAFIEALAKKRYRGVDIGTMPTAD